MTTTFRRFAAVSIGSGLFANGLFWLLSGDLPVAVANAVVTVVGTWLTNEIHGRWTFQTGPTRLRQHLESGFTVFVGYLVSTGAVLLLQVVQPGASTFTQQVVYFVATSGWGLVRYVALNSHIFRKDRVLAGSSLVAA
ncbi:hypothetical protein D5S17_13080 [Pseudonocardiaceae bacterium YIM PH 21723]|nr:hypothetical protein D5S17_13080 [Pseudonocardiaceae bacterium YIM PH 21723]